MLTPYKASLNPDTMSAAMEAFELAWAEVNLPDDLNEQTARDLIARRIVDAAVDQGMDDPVRMKAYALRVFRKPD